MENTGQQTARRPQRPRLPRKPAGTPSTTPVATTEQPPPSSTDVRKPVVNHVKPVLSNKNPVENDITGAAVAGSTSTLKKRRTRHRNRNKSNTITTAEVELATQSVNSAVQIQSQVKQTASLPLAAIANEAMPPPPTPPSKEQVLAEREAKRVAKQAAKHKIADAARNMSQTPPPTAAAASDQGNAVSVAVSPPQHTQSAAVTNGTVATATAATSASSDDVQQQKSRDAVLAEREAKKLAKLSSKNKTSKAATTTDTNVQPAVDAQKSTDTAVPAVAVAGNPAQPVVEKLEQLHIADKPVLSKAERRAKQEAQRAAKASAVVAKQSASSAAAPKTGDHPAAASGAATAKSSAAPIAANKSPATLATNKPILHRVKLFKHLYSDRPFDSEAHLWVHQACATLGTQYANRVVVGSNARCIAFLAMMKMIIRDFETPPKAEFTRGLEAAIQPCIGYLHSCRPLSVSVFNALRHIKWQISQLPADQPEREQRVQLLESIDTYVRDQVEKAAQAISISVQQKISNGDVILTFGCSSLITHILEEAQKRKVDFRVVVVDARPDHEGQEMLRRLVAQGVRCTCVLVNAIGFIMPVVTKVLLGAHALLANGYVMSRAGTAQVALMAKSHNVPVLVCCETHKFSERVQTDAFVYNEIGAPGALVLRPRVLPAGTRPGASGASALAQWEQLPHLTPLNLCYDITPPELVTAVVTELAILPCTSVPVILRIQPS